MPPGAKPGMRYGGRTKGTPNKSKAEVADLIDQVCPGWSPLQMMAFAARTGAFPVWDHANNCAATEVDGSPLMVPISEKTRGTLLKEVCEYRHPKLKAIEHSDPNGNPLGGGLAVTFVAPGAAAASKETSDDDATSKLS